MRRPRLPRDTQELLHWYERYISPLSLVAGFLADNYILLRRVDLWTSNLLLFSYLTICALGIVLINLIETGRLRTPWALKVAPFIPVVVQFSFGGLFSGFLSLYSRSAAFAVSWIFVVLLAALLIGNERFTRMYVRFSFQVSLYFTVLFSFLIFYLPVILRQIGPYIFLASGGLALVGVTLFFLLLRFLVPERAVPERTKVARRVAVIFVVFNILYFTGAIPPLPLALKEAGVYHGIARAGDEYHLFYEPLPWYQQYLNYNTVFHRTENEPAYVYTAIFAPSGLSVTVFHEWQYWGDREGAWVTAETVPFYIVGGRDGGYRGYSVKSGLEPGSWRVNVITQYGQTIGRVSFQVVDVPSPVAIQEVTR